MLTLINHIFCTHSKRGLATSSFKLQRLYEKLMGISIVLNCGCGRTCGKIRKNATIAIRCGTKLQL